MHRDEFVKIAADVLFSLPAPFRERMHNVAVLVEGYPPGQGPRHRHPRRPRRLTPPGSRRRLMGVFVGVPITQKSSFDVCIGPDHIVLYQKNIEAVCRNRHELREQIRLTIIHEVGHYFGLDEERLKDV
jgi:predicted Zn-dependent protease with MMP-like domain